MEPQRQLHPTRPGIGTEGGRLQDDIARGALAGMLKVDEPGPCLGGRACGIQAAALRCVVHLPGPVAAAGIVAGGYEYDMVAAGKAREHMGQRRSAVVRSVLCAQAQAYHAGLAHRIGILADASHGIGNGCGVEGAQSGHHDVGLRSHAAIAGLGVAVSNPHLTSFHHQARPCPNGGSMGAVGVVGNVASQRSDVGLRAVDDQCRRTAGLQRVGPHNAALALCVAETGMVEVKSSVHNAEDDVASRIGRGEPHGLCLGRELLYVGGVGDDAGLVGLCLHHLGHLNRAHAVEPGKTLDAVCRDKYRQKVVKHLLHDHTSGTYGLHVGLPNGHEGGDHPLSPAPLCHGNGAAWCKVHGLVGLRQCDAALTFVDEHAGTLAQFLGYGVLSLGPTHRAQGQQCGQRKVNVRFHNLMV